MESDIFDKNYFNILGMKKKLQNDDIYSNQQLTIV